MAIPIVPSKHGEPSANDVTEAAHVAQLRANDLINDMDRRLAQLNSLLACSYGFGQEWLSEMGEKHRDNLMWLASDLGREVEGIFDEIKTSTFAAEVGRD